MASYRGPGVQIRIVDNPGNALLPSGLRIPCIVATGLTVKPVKDIAITRGAGQTDTITGYTTGQVTNVTAVGDFPSLAQYKENTDWRQVDNTILWITNGQAPTAAATYFATVNIPKVSADYNKGVLYTNIQDVRNDFGAELINGVVTPVTAAAKLCFDNGAPVLMIVQPTTGSQSDLQTAVDAVKIEDVDMMVVPQACNTTLDNYVRNHVLTQSSPSVKHERVWLRSADGMSDAVTTIQGYAVGQLNERVTVMAPPAFVTTFKDSVTTQDQDVLLPSGYMAAMYAGVVANPNSDAATPLTRKSFVGIKSLSTFNYTEVDKNNLGGSGVTVIENNRGVFRVRHALTTDTTNVNRLTQSVVFIKDNVRKELRTLLDSSFIGSKIDNSLASRVNSTIDAYLRQKVKDTIIKSYRNIQVTQDLVDPRTLNVTFDMAPIYPAEFIDMTISLFV